MLVLEQYRVHSLGSLLVHGRSHMTVEVDGRADAADCLILYASNGPGAANAVTPLGHDASNRTAPPGSMMC